MVGHFVWILSQFWWVYEEFQYINIFSEKFSLNYEIIKKKNRKDFDYILKKDVGLYGQFSENFVQAMEKF